MIRNQWRRHVIESVRIGAYLLKPRVRDVTTGQVWRRGMDATVGYEEWQVLPMWRSEPMS